MHVGNALARSFHRDSVCVHKRKLLTCAHMAVLLMSVCKSTPLILLLLSLILFLSLTRVLTVNDALRRTYIIVHSPRGPHRTRGIIYKYIMYVYDF